MLTFNKLPKTFLFEKGFILILILLMLNNNHCKPQSMLIIVDFLCYLSL